MGCQVVATQQQKYSCAMMMLGIGIIKFLCGYLCVTTGYSYRELE
jgi:hypothetical protein